jgi:hypothetical protein
MAKHYGSGLIGLDMKPKRIIRHNKNRYMNKSWRWLWSAIGLVLVGLLLTQTR